MYNLSKYIHNKSIKTLLIFLILLFKGNREGLDSPSDLEVILERISGIRYQVSGHVFESKVSGFRYQGNVWRHQKNRQTY